MGIVTVGGALLALGSLGHGGNMAWSGKLRERRVNRSGVVLVTCLMAALGGCINKEVERERTIQAGMKRCADMGKQFVLRSIEQPDPAFAVSEFHTFAEFVCVGPGDQGYVPPK